MSDDSELERLKAKRLAEMQKNIDSRQDKAEAPEPENPRDVVVKSLGFRGMEVLQNAESQFPREAGIVVGKLSELIRSGEIAETLDGGKLLALFRAVGLNVRMQTKINVEQDGKFVSLADKFSSKGDD